MIKQQRKLISVHSRNQHQLLTLLVTLSLFTVADSSFQDCTNRANAATFSSPIILPLLWKELELLQMLFIQDWLLQVLIVLHFATDLSLQKFGERFRHFRSWASFWIHCSST